MTDTSEPMPSASLGAGAAAEPETTVPKAPSCGAGSELQPKASVKVADVEAEDVVLYSTTSTSKADKTERLGEKGDNHKNAAAAKTDPDL